jgi:hypothetical protein
MKYLSCPKLCQGDEVLSVNGRVLQGLTHRQAILLFKEVRQLAKWTLQPLPRQARGPIALYLARRGRNIPTPLKERGGLRCSMRGW